MARKRKLEETPEETSEASEASEEVAEVEELPEAIEVTEPVEESLEKRKFRALIANYKAQNPLKYAKKEKSLLEQLDQMK